MKTFNTIFNTIYQKLLLILGSSFCLWIFYVRVILVRIPKEITFSCKLCIAIYLLLATISGYMLLQELYRRIYKTSSYKTSDNKILIAIKEKWLLPLQNTYKASLSQVYEFFIDIHGGIIKELLHRCVILLHYIVSSPYWYNVTMHRWIYVSIHVLPRLCMVTAFLVDAMVYQYFHFLYKTIWVLIIPLIWNVSFYCLKKIVDLQKRFVGLLFDITVTDEASGDKTTYEFQGKDVSDEVLSHYPFLQTEEDLDMLIEDYKQFDAVDGKFLKILDSSGPIPQVSSEYNLAMMLFHGLSLILWSYMSIMTLLVNLV